MIGSIDREPPRLSRPYEALIGYKRWATLDLNHVLAENLGRVVEFDREYWRHDALKISVDIRVR